MVNCYLDGIGILLVIWIVFKITSLFSAVFIGQNNGTCTRKHHHPLNFLASVQQRLHKIIIYTVNFLAANSKGSLAKQIKTVKESLFWMSCLSDPQSWHSLTTAICQPCSLITTRGPSGLCLQSADEQTVQPLPAREQGWRDFSLVYWYALRGDT